MRFKGGVNPFLEWYEPESRPIVIMTPALNLTLGGDFAFASRWALMQYHSWTDRRFFLDLSDAEVKSFFHAWIKTPASLG